MNPQQPEPGPAERIAQLERQIEELKRRLPAHSIPPAMIAQLDELEEELARQQARLDPGS